MPPWRRENARARESVNARGVTEREIPPANSGAAADVISGASTARNNREPRSLLSTRSSLTFTPVSVTW